MESVFTIAGRLLHQDPHLGLDATYTPTGGSPQAVRVVPRYDPEVEGLLSAGTRRPTLQVDLLLSDVPIRPKDGDTLRVQDTNYRVRSATKQQSGVFWRLDLDPA